MRTLTLWLLLTSWLLGAHALKGEYPYTDGTITSRTLFPGLKTDFTLFVIPAQKSRYRVSAESLVDAFAHRGIAVDAGRERYVTFVKRSPVDTAPIAAEITDYYTMHYPSIRIHRIVVTPRVYTPRLPAGYTVHMGGNSYKSAEGTLYAETPAGKKLFFDYRVDADVGVLRTRLRLKRGTLLVPGNVTRANVPLTELKAPPLCEAPDGAYRLKRLLREDAVILMRHVERAPLVNRGAEVSATLKAGQVLIQFRATALQDGGIHDIIAVQKPDGQRIQAVVVGENRVEIE